MLTIRDLSKTYPNGVRALRRIQLDIPDGLFGLLGPNGSGKSTLMRTLATLQEADTGRILLDQADIFADTTAHRRRLGYLPQEFGVYPGVPARALLLHLALLKGIVSSSERREQVDALLERTRLYRHRKQAVSSFSGGMRRRFGIAQALLGDPRLLIVDEPTAGLDPEERHRFHDLLVELGERKVVVLSTHIVEDVRQLCSRMAILHEGRVVATGRPAELVEDLAGRIWHKTVARQAVAAYRESWHVLSTQLAAGQTQVRVLSEECPEDGFAPLDPDLEDVYFSVLASGGRA